jgi:hypothetical protein
MLRNKRIARGICFLILAATAVVPAAAQEFIYDSEGRRNPFIPLVTPDGRFQKLEADERKAESEDIKLEGILFDKYGISYAIVNGMVSKTGDVVGEFQILKIEEKKVIFMREGQEKTLELKTPGT